ncbi:MAG: PepSY domain-containing protein [Burkholderiales bacterium]
MELKWIALGLGLCAGVVYAQEMKIPKTKASMETCMQAVLKQKPGKVVQLEMKNERGTPTYEFEIKGADGKDWDVECSANTGNVTEVEQNVGSADHELFKAKMKISEDEAKQIALKAHPGKIEEPTDFEIEPDGKASYEFDIQTKDGKEMKVEVDAASGKIVEANAEIYGIGEDESPK